MRRPWVPGPYKLFYFGIFLFLCPRPSFCRSLCRVAPRWRSEVLLVLLPHNPALLAHISPAHSDLTQKRKPFLLNNKTIQIRLLVPYAPVWCTCVRCYLGAGEGWGWAGFIMTPLGENYTFTSRGERGGRDGFNLFLLDLSKPATSHF